MAEIVDQFNEAFSSKRWHDVLRLKDEVLSILQATKSTRGEAVYFINLGIAYRNLGDTNKAIECQESAIEIYKNLDDDNGVAYCYTNLGNAFQQLGMLKKAQGFHEKAIALARRAGNQELVQIALGNLFNAQQAEKAKTLTVINGDKKIHFAMEGDRVDPRKRCIASSKDRPIMAADLSKRESVFISYSRLDKQVVEPFVNDLVRKGIAVYFDLKDRPIDDVHSLVAGLSEGLAQCDALLVFLSQQYLGSAWCRAELQGFLHHSIRERRSSDPPILILDLDQACSADKLTAMCFGSRSPTQQKEPGTQDAEPPGIGSKVRKEVERILESSRLDADQVVQSLWRIPFDKSDRKGQLEEVVEQLMAMRTKKVERRTYSDRRDFDLIWDEAFKNQKQKKAGSTQERIVDALASPIPASAMVPVFDKPQELWDYVWKLYKHKTIAPDIDIASVLEEHRPPTKFEGDLLARLERYSDPSLFAMLKGIADKKHSIRLFDRPFMESTSYYDEWSSNIESGEKQLEPRSLRGHPLHLLFGESQCRRLLMPLQYTYYRYLEEESQSSLVDAAVLAGLWINVDIWFEVLRDEEAFMETIIGPLSSGRDIRSIFP